MTPSTTTPRPLDSRPVPVQAKLAAAWGGFMFMYLYVDYLHLYKPNAIDDIRSGSIFVFEISPPLLTVFFALVAVPAGMIALSAALPAPVNRALNLVVAAVYIPVTAFNALGETWEWAAFYGLSIALELLLLAFILRSAWTWPRTPVFASTPGASDRRQTA